MNTDSRIKNSFKNIGFGFVTQGIQMLLGFISRTVFINYLAIEYLAAQGLFSNILGLLALAELGVGNALMYSLYKPIAEKDHALLNDLIVLFKKIYFYIGCAVAAAGLALVPFLKDIVATDHEVLLRDIYVIYLLFLANSVASYFFSHRYSILVADQRNYVVSKLSIIVTIIQTTIQILSLVLFQNFILYLVIQVAGTFVSNLLVYLKTNKQYPFLKLPARPVSRDIKHQLKVNTFSTSLFKFSGAIVNNTSNIIINAFVGLVLLGKYYNYLLLVSMATSLVIQVFQGLTSSVANVNATAGLEKKREIFNVLNFMSFMLYGLGALGLALYSDIFIEVWIGDEFLIRPYVAILIALNFYILGMQNVIWTFKTTMGFFKEGRWLTVFSAFLNLGLSVLFGYLWGLEGILFAPVLSRLLTTAWYVPKVVFEMGLQLNFSVYIWQYLLYASILAVCFLVFKYLFVFNIHSFLMLGVAALSLCVFFIAVNFLLFRNTREVKYLKNMFYSLKARLLSR